MSAPSPLGIVADCTDAALDPGNPGVVRTARLLARQLANHKGLATDFVLWDRSLRDYRHLRPAECARLASNGGPRIDPVLGAIPDERAKQILLLLEAPMDGQMPERLLWAAARGLQVAAILYDAIPLTHPALCVPSIVARFPEYLRGIACIDAAFAISRETLTQFEVHLGREDLPAPPARSVVGLPAQFSAYARIRDGRVEDARLRLLSVGSIEPRKNQLTLIDAFAGLTRRRPELGIELTLVGNRFAGAEDLADEVAALASQLPGLHWVGSVSDDALAALYRASSLSVYPSLVEGFGLPIVESLWLGRPCLCHAGGVMQELASGGGCRTTDMANPSAIESALEALATRPEVLHRLTMEAQGRTLKTWDEYGAEIAGGLFSLAGDSGLVSPEAQTISELPKPPPSQDPDTPAD